MSKKTIPNNYDYFAEIDCLSLNMRIVDSSVGLNRHDLKLRAIGSGTAKDILKRALEAAKREQKETCISICETAKKHNGDIDFIISQIKKIM